MTQFNVDFLLPPGTGLQLTHLHQMHHQQLVLVVNSTSLLASCPVCQTSSRQVHSYYTRTIADLCWADRQVRLELHVRRFVCSNTACSRRTFAEQFGEQGKRVCPTDKALRISVANHWSHAGRKCWRTFGRGSRDTRQFRYPSPVGSSH